MEFLIPENKNNEQRPTFENTTYLNNHKKKQILTIRSSKSNFNLKLKEQLRIEKFSDVFLDSFGTFNIGGDNNNSKQNKQFFMLKIDQFNLQQKSNYDDFNNTIVIPNEDSNGTGFASHKSKKHNYVSTIQPGIITNISGTLKDKVASAILNDHSIQVISKGNGVSPLTIIIDYHDNHEPHPNQGNITLFAHTSEDISSFNFNDKAASEADVAESIKDVFNGNGLNDKGITANVTDDTVFFSTTGSAEIISIGGTYFDTNATEYHPHFFAEFAIIEND
jgi:hypothetical protein